MNKFLLSETEIIETLESTPEFQLFHVKPLKEQLLILQLIKDNLVAEISKIKTKRSKGYFNTKKLRSKNQKRLAELSFLKQYCRNFSELLLQQAIDSQEFILTTQNKESIAAYRYKARFIFSTSTDLIYVKGYSLLQEHGWYSKTNPNGLVKDHRVSIKYGYDNNICPSIIGHIANCELLPFSINAKKSKNCSISLDQLHTEISNYLRIV